MMESTKSTKLLYMLIILFTLNGYCEAKKTVRTQKIDANYNYDLYKKQFHKQNQNSDQQDKRKKSFDQNVELINKHNEEESNYTMNVNKYSDLTEEDLKKLCNYRPNNTNRLSQPRLLRNSVTNIPPINWAELGKVTPPKDQGRCGSCWAFTLNGYFESLMLIHTQQEYDFSQQYTTTCTGYSNGCEGGWPGDIVPLLLESGFPTESASPYLLQDYGTYYYDNSLHQNSQCTGFSMTKLPNTVIAQRSYTSVDDEFLKQALSSNGPIMVAITSGFSAFSSYSSGIFDGCKNYNGYVDHAVLLVGFTSEGHWIIKNSWGSDWGENGYMTIDKNHNCQITSYPEYIEVEFTEQSYSGQPVQQETTDNSTNTDNTDNSTHNNSTDNSTHNNSTDNSTHNNSTDNNSTDNSTHNNSTDNNSTDNSTHNNSTDNSTHNNSTDSNSTDNSTHNNSTDNSTHNNSTENTTANGELTFSIFMEDEFGDGWNGVSLGVYIGVELILQFGHDFQTGSTHGPVTFSFNRSQRIKVMVVTQGLWTEQIKFTITNITNNNGSVVYQRSPSAFDSSKIFYEYCAGCISQKVKYFIHCTDSWGDGWNGNSFALKVGSTYLVFGRTFTDGYQYGPYQVEIERGTNVQVWPFDDGTFKQEIGFRIQDSVGIIVFEHTIGSSYSHSAAMGSFCADCVNLFSVKSTSGQWTKPIPKTQEQQEKTKQSIINSEKDENNSDPSQGYLIGIFILSILLALMSVVALLGLFYIYRLYKNSQQVDMQETGYQLHKSTVTQSEFPDKTHKDFEDNLKSFNQELSKSINKEISQK